MLETVLVGNVRVSGFAKWPIAWKFSAALLPVLLAPPILIGYRSFQESRAREYEEQRVTLATVASLGAKHASQLFSDTKNVARLVAQLPSVQGFVAQPTEQATREVRATLAAVSRSSEHFGSVYLVGRDGICLASSLTTPQGEDQLAGQNYGRRDYFREARRDPGHVFVSEFRMGKTTREGGIYFSVTIPDQARPDSLDLSVAVVKLKQEAVANLVATLRKDSGGAAGSGKHALPLPTFRLVDGDGVLANPSLETRKEACGAAFEHCFVALGKNGNQAKPRLWVDQVYNLGLDAYELEWKAREARGGPARAGFMQIDRAPFGPRLVGYAAISESSDVGAPWTMIVERPLSEVQAPLEELRREQIATYVPAALAAVLVMLLIVMRITRRISRVAAASLAAAGGDLSQRVEVGAPDEIGHLMQAFNQMTQNLDATLKDAQDARQEALAASAAKSEFLAHMSHELRTPLNAIIGYSEILIEDAEEQGGQEQVVSDLTKIRAAGKHLLGLINDILDLSKIESGKLELHVEEFELEAALLDVAATVRPLVEKNGNRLALDFEEGIGRISSDLTRLRQCLLNLLSNAAKFTKDGTVTLSCRREGGDIVLSVRDTGIGLTPEQRAKIFQPFVQADSSTTKQYGGTGLGLTITAQFCQLMAGSIEVESEVGRGSAFIMRLPDTSLAPEASQEALEDAATILVIDDDPVARDILHRNLTRAGFLTKAFADGASALEAARKERPDAITLDVMMPQMDGWMVLRQLKEDPELARIPVIIMSMVKDKSLGFALGASDYLVKPIDGAQLYAALEKQGVRRSRHNVLIFSHQGGHAPYVQHLLSAGKFGVVVASSPRDAKTAFEVGRPEVIVLERDAPGSEAVVEAFGGEAGVEFVVFSPYDPSLISSGPLAGLRVIQDAELLLKWLEEKLPPPTVRPSRLSV